jgi:hypothetical protein
MHIDRRMSLVLSWTKTNDAALDTGYACFWSMTMRVRVRALTSCSGCACVLHGTSGTGVIGCMAAVMVVAWCNGRRPNGAISANMLWPAMRIVGMKSCRTGRLG